MSGDGVIARFGCQRTFQGLMVDSCAQELA